MNNLEIYEKVRKVPSEAKKTIGAGRLKGMTDINPMWRIKCLTEQFGPCGIGWYFKTTDKWIDEVDNERVASVTIELFVKYEGEWSQPIPGVGGSKLSTMEKNGLYVSDEAYKMATTDAISVACKCLGVGADVYWDKDNTKYSNNRTQEENIGAENIPESNEAAKDLCSEKQVNLIKNLIKKRGDNESNYLAKYKDAKSFADLNKAQAKALIDYLMREQ